MTYVKFVIQKGFRIKRTSLFYVAWLMRSKLRRQLVYSVFFCTFCVYSHCIIAQTLSLNAHFQLAQSILRD